MKIRPIILSGGCGTRLWPVSRRDYPKQFAALVGQHSLLAATFEMLRTADRFLPPVIVANEDHKFFVLDILRHSPWEETQVLLEPCGRNTAGAALTAALAEEDKNILHLLIPSDHIIKNPAAFLEAMNRAAAAAAEGCIALFGIQPTYAETGYGYIQRGAATAWKRVDRIESFKEKPDIRMAERLLAQGALWNSGIFLYDPKIIIQEIKQLKLEQVKICADALAAAYSDLGCRILDKSYEKLPDISFDHLVMENTEAGVVVACDIGWSDIGSWHALWQLEDKNEQGNVVQGAVVSVDVGNSLLRSDGPVIGVVGLNNIAVIATKDAVLVTPLNRSQDVKSLVTALKVQQNNIATSHRCVMRPWGSYEAVAAGHRFQVKHIIVKPGQSLSLQMHQHRAEHWVVVAGTACVECDDIKKSVYENESVFIPKGAKHRLSNPGKLDLQLVEVQSGEYLEEDDIVRLSDEYRRV